MDSTFARMIETLRLIPMRTKVTAPEVWARLQAQGYTVTRRTVERDLRDLAAPFGLVCDDRSKPFGWSATERTRINLPGMDATQAMSLRLMQTYLGDLLPESSVEELRPYFNEARRTLEQIYGNSAVQRWLDKVAIVPATQPKLPPAVKRVVHDTVTEALLLERQLDIQYVAPGGNETKKATVHPLGLVQHGVVHYLVLTFFRYHDVRLLPLHRIKNAKLLEAPSGVPPGFNLKQYIANGAFGFGYLTNDAEPIQMVLVFDAEVGAHLLEAPLSSDQAVVDLPGDRLRITATVLFTRQLVWWLLGFGPGVKVEKPLQLRREVAAQLSEAAAQYAKPSATPT